MAWSDHVDEDAHRYLPEAYARVSRHWADYRDSKERGDTETAGEALRLASTLLCETLRRLSDDTAFWSAIEALPRECAEQGLPPGQPLTELDGLLLKERDLFVQVIGDSGAAERLIVDLSMALDESITAPDTYTVSSVRERLSPIIERVCAAADSEDRFHESEVGERPERRWFRRARTVGKGLIVLIGATLVVIDGIGTIIGSLDPISGLKSAGSGVGLIVKQIPR